jgi:pimeloyl-ACP methyl ester carboxylesterase
MCCPREQTNKLLRATVALTILLAACASPVQHAERIANRGGMQALHLHGTHFDHVAYFSGRNGGRQLAVFIEGDGTPWIEDGTRVATDPTPRNPLALRLALRTPGPVLYLGRPCYFESAPGCSPRLWTSARYSEEVVASLTVAITDFARRGPFDSIILVGHSGGGTLATLIAPRVPLVTEVITIGAVLDISAWTQSHGYLALDASLNPSDLAPLPARIVERHLIGTRDTVVPDNTRVRYTQRLPAASVIRFDGFDHRCCWEREWPRIWREVALTADSVPQASR